MAGGNNQGGGSMAQLWLLIMILPAGIFFLPTVIVMGVGMLPTFVALIVDRSATRLSWICVGGLNFAGCFPYVLDLWFGRQTIARGLEIASDPFALVVMFGMAALGWMFFLAIPPVSVAVVDMLRKNQVTRLRDHQGELVQEWGRKVVDEAQQVLEQHYGQVAAFQGATAKPQKEAEPADNEEPGTPQGQQQG